MKNRLIKYSFIVLTSYFCLKMITGARDELNFFYFNIDEIITLENMINYFYICLFWIIPSMLIYIELFGIVDRMINQMSVYFVLRCYSCRKYMKIIFIRVIVDLSIYMILLYGLSWVMDFTGISVISVISTMTRMIWVVMTYIIFRILFKRYEYLKSIILLNIIVLSFYAMISNIAMIQEIFLGSTSFIYLGTNFILIGIMIIIANYLMKRTEY